jgi:predicted O-methyltransferase YrrM
MFVGHVHTQTMDCRAWHGCNIMPFEDPNILVALASRGCKRILELGTGLGFSTLWLAQGAPEAHIDTVEHDPEHVRRARANFVAFGVADRVMVHEGEFSDVLVGLEPGYDLAVFDGWGPERRYLREFVRLLRLDGVLVSSNLDYMRLDEQQNMVPDAEREAYCVEMCQQPWRTALLEDKNIAVSVRAA